MESLIFGENSVLTPSAILFAVNVAVSSVGIGCLAGIVLLCVSRARLTLRHGILSVAVVLMLVCPLPLWVATHAGIGLVAVPSPTSSSTSSLGPGVSTTRFSDEAPLDLDDDRSLLRERDALVNRSEVASNRTPSNREGLEPDLGALPRSILERDRVAGSGPMWIGQLSVLVWALVSVVCGLTLLRSLYVVTRWRRSLTSERDPRVAYASRRVLGRSSSAGGIRVFMSATASAPLSLGWWRPIIVFPQGLADALDDDELESVLAHEAAHIARQDTRMALLQRAALVVFWWNPVLWFINRQIDGLREQIADDHVVVNRGHGVPLAKAIVRVAEWSRTKRVFLPLAVTLSKDSHALENRIMRLTDEERTVSVQLKKSGVATLVIVSVALMTPLVWPALRASSQAEKERTEVAWQTDLVALQKLLKEIAAKARIPVEEAFYRRPDTEVLASPESSGGIIDLKPAEDTVQYRVNDALKRRNVSWEFEVGKAQRFGQVTYLVPKSAIAADTKDTIALPGVIKSAGGMKQSAPFTIVIKTPPRGAKYRNPLVGDRVKLKGTVGDASTNKTTTIPFLYTGPIVTYYVNHDPQPLFQVGLDESTLILVSAPDVGASETSVPSTDETVKADTVELSGKIAIDGSGFVYPLIEALAETFAVKHRDVRVVVGCSGTGGGIKRLAFEETDFSTAARPIRAEEMRSCQQRDVRFIEFPVAYDAVVVVVHPENDWVDALTLDQLARLFKAGDAAAQWNDVDPSWPETPIKIFAPSKDSGVFEGFRSRVAPDRVPLRADLVQSDDDNVLLKGLMNEPNGIGIFSIGYYLDNNERLRRVPIVAPDTGEPVVPTEESIRAGAYAPFSWPLLVYLNAESLKREEVTAFSRHIIRLAKEAAADAGCLPLSDGLALMARKHVEQQICGTHFLNPDGSMRMGTFAQLYKSVMVTETIR